MGELPWWSLSFLPNPRDFQMNVKEENPKVTDLHGQSLFTLLLPPSNLPLVEPESSVQRKMIASKEIYCRSPSEKVEEAHAKIVLTLSLLVLYSC